MDYGTVTHKKILVLRIVCSPFPAGTNEAPVMRALAEDEDGNEYTVDWPMTNPEAEDLSDSCDWEVYTVTEGA